MLKIIQEFSNMKSNLRNTRRRHDISPCDSRDAYMSHQDVVGLLINSVRRVIRLKHCNPKVGIDGTVNACQDLSELPPT